MASAKRRTFKCSFCGGRVREIECWTPGVRTDGVSVLTSYKYSCERCGYAAAFSVSEFNIDKPSASMRRFARRAKVGGGRAGDEVLTWMPEEQRLVVGSDGTTISVVPVNVRGKLMWRRVDADRYRFTGELLEPIPAPHRGYYPTLQESLTATATENVAVAAIQRDPPELQFSKAAKRAYEAVRVKPR